MGHFTIDLPENKKGDVRWGDVFKMQFSLFRKNKSESSRGYIVTVSDSNGIMEYRLFKSQNGKWSTDPEGQTELDGNLLTLIKDAIIKKELNIL